MFSESHKRLPQECPPDVPVLPEDVPTEVQPEAAHPERSRKRRKRRRLQEPVQMSNMRKVIQKPVRTHNPQVTEYYPKNRH